MSNGNLATVAKALAAFSAGTLETYLELYVPDARMHFLPPGLPPGVQGARLYYQMFLGGIPDARVTLEDILEAGDRVACRFRVTGTHTGELMGLSPTARTVTFNGITILRMAHGRCVERWSETNVLAVLQELGEAAAAAAR